MTKFYSVLTNYGVTAFAQAISTKQPLNILKMAVGDGNGRAVTPDSSRTALVREVYRANISSIKLDVRNNKQVIFELTIPEDVGGFYIREMGIFDHNEKLVAIANTPESYKPQLTEGSGKVQVLRMILLVSSSDSVNLTVDNSLIWAKRSELTPKDLDENSQSIIEENGHSHRLPIATLLKKGITQLFSGLDSDAENMAATPKAIKILKGLIDAITRNLGNYIPNSKKSNAVNSNSADTVATSVAAKTAYDKGVEAKNAADNANNNANGRVSKSGDTITGLLELKNGDYSSINQWNLSGKQARSETLPDSNSNFFKISYRADNGNTELHAVHFPKRGLSKNVAYEDWVDGNYIPRNGDVTINGRHFFKNNNSWISIISTAGAESGIDFTNWNGKHAQASIRAVDVGGFADELRFFTTPQGSNYETDRREHTMTLGYTGDLWTKKYGWLHNFFAKQSDNNNIWININNILNELNNTVIKRGDFIRFWYPNHYAGTEVYKIRHLGLMLTVMNTTGANGEYTLPESYDGHAIALAQDRGDGRVSLEGSRFLGGNKIRLTGRSDTHCHVLVIGFKNV